MVARPFALLALLGGLAVTLAAPARLECVVTSDVDCRCAADGVRSATACLRACIAGCHARDSGGGTQVTFPKGLYYTGALNLTSNMVLQLDQGAVILGCVWRVLPRLHSTEHCVVRSTRMPPPALSAAAAPMPPVTEQGAGGPLPADHAPLGLAFHFHGVGSDL